MPRVTCSNGRRHRRRGRPAALAEYWIAAARRGGRAPRRSRPRLPRRQVGRDENPPSCTFVAAVVDGPVLVSGWVGRQPLLLVRRRRHGRSRCRSTTRGPARQIAQGAAREVAEQDPRAHAITRWLGVDAPTALPTCASVPVGAGGWVLVCSDGLWNYCSAARRPPRGSCTTRSPSVGDDPLAVASALCDWANEQGGHDNVTVALAHLTPAAATARTRLRHRNRRGAPDGRMDDRGLRERVPARRRHRRPRDRHRDLPGSRQPPVSPGTPPR